MIAHIERIVIYKWLLLNLLLLRLLVHYILNDLYEVMRDVQ